MTDEPAFTDDPVFDGLLRAIAAAPVPARPSLIERPLPAELGQTLGAFRLLEVIGKGGTGVVYRALDSRLDREVALKLLWDSAGDEARAERLLLEARTAAAFSDPRIASVYEVGQDHGRPFIAMELVKGAALSQRLMRGPLPPAEALALGLEIARALSSIHAQGWVHRDVKPENIATTGAGQIKLLDFGIARESGPRSSTEHIAGTAQYMAPEQQRGEALDARADVFAFGVVLQQLLSGRASRLAIDLPHRALRSLIVDCLAIDPARRPASGAALVARLEALQRGGARRQRRIYAAGLLALLVGAAGAALSRWSTPAPGPAPHSVRLTGNRLTRPISAAALSGDGLHFAYVDDDGLVIGETAAPDRTVRPDLLAEFVEAIPGSPDWMVLSSTAGGQLSVHRLGPAGARRIAQGDFKVASINPVDGRLSLVRAHSVTLMSLEGQVEQTYYRPAARIGFASWSPDGRFLAVGYSDHQDSEPEPCLQVWEAARGEVRFTLCTPRLAQAFAPVVSAWGPAGELLYAFSDRPGMGRGTSVLLQRLDPSGAAAGPPVPLLSLEGQFLASISMSQDRRLLTLRQEATLRPMVANISADGSLTGAARVGPSEFDESLSAWDSAQAIWTMSYREWVPRIRLIQVDEGRETAPELPGWAQTWPTPIAGQNQGIVFWYADRPADDGVLSWKLARTSSAGLTPLWTPRPPSERLSVMGAPPASFQVRCASRAPTCLLGTPDDGGYAILRLSLVSAVAEPLFRIEGFRPQTGAWAVLPDGDGLLVGTASSTLVRYALDGRVRSQTKLQELHWIRSIGVDPVTQDVYLSGHGPTEENFRIIRVAQGREEVVKKHGAIVYLNVLPSPDGHRLAYVEKALDTDIWLSFQ